LYIKESILYCYNVQRDNMTKCDSRPDWLFLNTLFVITFKLRLRQEHNIYRFVLQAIRRYARMIFFLKIDN
jgi:hypothetical protein